MPRKPIIEIIEMLPLHPLLGTPWKVRWESWVMSMLPGNQPDLWTNQDSEGRYTDPIHEDCQVACYLPSARVLCPQGGM